jgi:hypothetical protein
MAAPAAKIRDERFFCGKSRRTASIFHLFRADKHDHRYEQEALCAIWVVRPKDAGPVGEMRTPLCGTCSRLRRLEPEAEG